MGDKLLAEWFWIDRWLGSSAQGLAIEPRGLYREMLTMAWRLGARLPNDHAQIRRLIRATEDEWNRCWPLIESYWVLEDGVLINPTQVEVYEDAVRRHELVVARAKKGGVASARKRRKTRQIEPGLEPGLRTPSPSIPPPTPSNAGPPALGGAAPEARGAPPARCPTPAPTPTPSGVVRRYGPSDVPLEELEDRRTPEEKARSRELLVALRERIVRGELMPATGPPAAVGSTNSETGSG